MAEFDEIISVDPDKASILVVDDEPANLRLMEKVFDNFGYKHTVFTQDPTQALSLFQQHQSDLILLDLDMPVLDGYGVMSQLKKYARDKVPPILVLTAQHQQSHRLRALDEGALDYVTKPFDVNELMSRVRNLLQVRLAHKYVNLQNEILEQKVQQRTSELQETRLQVVRRLGRAAEYRDNETGLHIIRMSKIAVAIARAAGLDNEQCELLLNAAPMHDIGKIGIPDYVLLKPGKLLAEEWEIMKTHAQIGADILSGDESSLLQMAHDIAISHHEKWNGEGYPNGLQGESIPLVGRITALADVFDALTSERPYKQAWPVEKAVDYIRVQSGQHFDPRLVQFFIQQLDEIVAIRDQYAEPEKMSA